LSRAASGARQIALARTLKVSQMTLYRSLSGRVAMLPIMRRESMTLP
jgi:hypothetical protein